jgi:quercetin dioxygenase-like cupin family protein
MALLMGAAAVVGTSTATPPAGVTAIPLADGNLPVPVRVKLMDEDGGFGSGTSVTRIFMVKYLVEPGGSFGWHQHGGPLWVVVTAGTLHFYSGEDPECQAQVFPTGSAFLDPGDHTHFARNEGDTLLEVHVAFMLPTGGPPRIDVPAPGNCPF